jgi:glycosyltransferase involved in cell wall biosynthesis
MKILFGTTVPGPVGGIYAAEEPFHQELERLHNSVRTLPFGRRSDKESLPTKFFYRLFDLVRFATVSLSFKPDIVHLNSSYDKRALLRDVWYVLVSRAMHKPLFIKFHGTDSHLLSDRAWPWVTLTKVVVRYSTIGVLSMEEKNNFVQAGYVPSSISVVRNVVNIARYASSQARYTNPPMLLFIGRFILAKGLFDVIHAFRIVLDAGIQAKLVCVGDGPDKVNAVRLTQLLGLDANVDFTGYIPEQEAANYYLRAAALVSPTYHEEGFPMTIFQSLAAGMPIITTRIRAAADYLKDPENCLWVEPRDPKMLAEKMLYLLKNPDLQERMSTNNRKLALGFSAEKIVADYLVLYHRTLYGNKAALQ